jgi:hypothetical protein
MRTTEVVKREIEQLVTTAITCDCCGAVIALQVPGEMLGDTETVTVAYIEENVPYATDLCVPCVKNLLGDYIKSAKE